MSPFYSSLCELLLIDDDSLRSPGSGSGDGLIHGGSSGSRAPLGEVEFDSMGDVKRARYDH